VAGSLKKKGREAGDRSVDRARTEIHLFCWEEKKNGAPNLIKGGYTMGKVRLRCATEPSSSTGTWAYVVGVSEKKRL